MKAAPDSLAHTDRSVTGGVYWVINTSYPPLVREPTTLTLPVKADADSLAHVDRSITGGVYCVVNRSYPSESENQPHSHFP